ncbi:MAG: aldehyde ferredoxin oxidoreductase family protein [Desulfobacteraceae bacterium]|nr:MAG: aldehyde ferredoxin oxidoreductase family protein [Desulfobacteraceae bacterium]
MKNGYMEKILDIDLASGKIEAIDFPEKVKKQYLGGSGLGAWYLYNHTEPAKIDPLGPENTFVLLTGPVCGTPVYSSSRYEACAKAPLTGVWGEANSGGKVAQVLKSTGYDGLIIRNAADSPVCVAISQDRVEITAAGKLWGKDTYEMEGALKSEYGDKVNFFGIGLAGENKVPIAALMNDGTDGRAAGRGGLGAVLGSKNVKAIVVSRGSLKTPVYDREKLMASIEDHNLNMKELTEGLSEFGTAGVVTPNEESGDLPIKNWAQGQWQEGAQKISGPTMNRTILTKRYHCGRCAIGCGRIIKVDGGPYAVPEGPGPEYETLAMLGSNCLIDNLEAIAKANELCNRYGLDTIATGAVIAFGMEAYDRGLVTKSDTDSIELIWGNADAMLEMVKAIGENRGFGKILGQGVRKAAEIIGGNAVEFACHVKGMELPAHDPRARFSNVLGYTTCNRGACHLSVFGMDFESGLKPPNGIGFDQSQDPYEVDGKAKFSVVMQDLMSVFDALTVCKFIVFGGVDVPSLAHWLNCITGWKFDVASLLKAGTRIFTVKRLYNNRLGISRKDDALPPRLTNFSRDTGGSKDRIPPQGQLLNDYYRLRKWNEFGEPSPELLRELEIDF